MISVGPCPQLAELEGEISVPDRPRHGHVLLRAAARRRHGGRLLRPPRDPARARGHPLDRPGQAHRRPRCPSPPTTSTRSSRQALELMPELLGADGARDALRDQRTAVTDLRRQPDPGREPGARPVDRRRGLDQGGPRCRSRGGGVDDPRPLRDRHPPQRHRPLPPPPERSRAHAGCGRPRRSSRPTGSSTPPSSTSPTASSGSRRCTSRRRSCGAFFYETVGWERPHWYESNAALLEEYGDAVMPREHEWDARWWSPIINAEHLRMREAAGVIDLSAFCVFDIEGPGALESVQRTCVGAVRRRRRQGRLHPGARREGRLPLRPDRDAARRRPLPGRHRRRARHGRPASGSATSSSTTAPRR